ncbi:MAG: ankyrin repeat domain-containing protein [Bacteroidota bacterium]
MAELKPIQEMLVSLALILLIGVPMYQYIMNPYRVMQRAFQDFDIKKLEWAIEHGVDVNAPIDQLSPIVIAANERMYNFMEALAQAGAELNLTDSEGITLAGISSQRKDSTALEILGRFGADFHLKADSLGRNVLTQIVAQGKTDLLPIALRYTKRDALDPNGKAAFHYADVTSASMMEKLIAAGENPNAPDIDGNSPMHTVSSEYAVENLHRLGGEIDGNNPCGISPLFFQVANGNGRAYQYLLNNGANIDHLDDYGQTVLTYAMMTEDEILYEQVANDYCKVFPDKCKKTYKHLKNSGIAALATVVYTKTAHQSAIRYLGHRAARRGLFGGLLSRLGGRMIPVLGWIYTAYELSNAVENYNSQRSTQREATDRIEELRRERAMAQHILRMQFLTCNVVLTEEEVSNVVTVESSEQLTVN